MSAPQLAGAIHPVFEISRKIRNRKPVDRKPVDRRDVTHAYATPPTNTKSRKKLAHHSAILY
jgi:hypothetical protein